MKYKGYTIEKQDRGDYRVIAPGGSPVIAYRKLQRDAKTQVERDIVRRREASPAVQKLRASYGDPAAQGAAAVQRDDAEDYGCPPTPSGFTIRVRNARKRRAADLYLAALAAVRNAANAARNAGQTNTERDEAVTDLGQEYYDSFNTGRRGL